ncbi:MAG: type I-C CRISPR-associated protein Cas5c [Capsulimonadaceae bacterium]|nr:type I-C CRISPR-associated protein Cas5c [Capsulimonadaceae bacterium]
MNYPPVEVKVWGPYALFTSEFKTERVTYPVITPSAARGVLEAIFWHKPMRWRVREIVVLNPIKHLSILRNEVSSRASPRNNGISITDDRAQRSSLVLKDVAYIIRADVYIPAGSTDADPAKYRDQFRRRIERGQCWQRPYLGCREFAAGFGPVDGTAKPIDDNRDLGRLLFDLDYGPERATPRFFNARLDGGVLYVPDSLYEGGGA